jgi:hypothetical protein
MSKECYSCPEIITNIGEASMFISGDKQYYQCSDCMDGANCFTCEGCGDGLASECVDYVPSRYREWWCISCAEDHESVRLDIENNWIFKEED